MGLDNLGLDHISITSNAFRPNGNKTNKEGPFSVDQSTG